MTIALSVLLAIFIVLFVAVCIFFIFIRHQRDIQLQDVRRENDEWHQKYDIVQNDLLNTQSDLHQKEQECVSAQTRSQELSEQLTYIKQQYSQVLEAEQQRLQQQRQEENARIKKESLEKEQNLKEESKILQALAPMNENISTLRKRLTAMEENRKEDLGALAEQLEGLGKQQRNLDKETTQLVGVLRNNKSRGAWGEVQLRNIVQAAGLVEHVDFDTQVNQTSSEKTNRPDMVVYIPSRTGKQGIPVDAKAPFSYYLEAQNIPDTAPENELRQKAELLKEHARALKAHIDELARRKYWEYFADTPDFVILFIPSEAWLAAALESDPTLLDYAFSKRVALCSPVTLWAVLKAVAVSWQQQEMTENARSIVELSGRVYSGFTTFGDLMRKLGGSIERTVTSYNRVIGNVEHTILPPMRKLQATSPDDIDIIEQIDGEKYTVRELTASELLNDDKLLDDDNQ